MEVRSPNSVKLPVLVPVPMPAIAGIAVTVQEEHAPTGMMIVSGKLGAVGA